MKEKEKVSKDNYQTPRIKFSQKPDSRKTPYRSMNIGFGGVWAESSDSTKRD